MAILLICASEPDNIRQGKSLPSVHPERWLVDRVISNPKHGNGIPLPGELRKVGQFGASNDLSKF